MPSCTEDEREFLDAVASRRKILPTEKEPRDEFIYEMEMIAGHLTDSMEATSAKLIEQTRRAEHVFFVAQAQTEELVALDRQIRNTVNGLEAFLHEQAAKRCVLPSKPAPVKKPRAKGKKRWATR